MGFLCDFFLRCDSYNHIDEGNYTMKRTVPNMIHERRQEKFLELLRPAHNRLESFAYAMTRDADEAKDLVSETLLRAYEHFDEIRNPSAFTGYLLTIASRLQKRRRWRHRIFEAFDINRTESIADTASLPDARVDVDTLYRALAQLPEAQRETVVLFEISGLSLDEIQGIQGGSLSGVKSRLVRGRERLRQLLGDADDQMTMENVNGEIRSTTTQTGTTQLFLRAINNG
jgi:RNA polymerase sigma-70 factor (ECF subfamily)